MKRYDEAKTAELLLYIAAQTEKDEAAGSTKLNKIPYFADRAHLRRYGSTITGAEYQREPQGPILRRMLPIIRRLERDGSAEEVLGTYHGKEQKRLIAHREPDLTSFTEEEVDTVDKIIDELWGMTARQVSDLSHQDPGWLAAGEDGNPILIQMALTGTPELTDRIRERAKQIADQIV